MTGTKKLVLAFTSAMIIASNATMAQATHPNAQAQGNGDYFGRSTTQPHAPQTPSRQHRGMAPAPWVMPRVTPASAPVQWMEAFDEAVGHYKPSLEDALVLKRPLNQEVERVLEWSKTTAKIAKQYRVLAKTLRAMPLPEKMPEAGTYVSGMADWYDDTATVMEDLIRPRRAARTMEELEASLKEVHDRSEALRQAYRTLKMMDSKMRVSYNIHPAKHDDALMKYVTRDPNL